MARICWPLLDGDVGAGGATGERGFDDRAEEAGLAPERPVDGLDNDARLGRDLRHRRRGIAALTEQGPGGGQDVAARLGSLLLASRRLVSTTGLDILGHSVEYS